MSKLKVVYGHSFEGWFNNKDLHPQPISNFVPEWYKNVKPDNLPGNTLEYTMKRKTVRTCPSFVDIWREGYVILSPQDYVIKITKDTYEYESFHDFSPITKDSNISSHAPEQMLKFYEDKSILGILKINLPLFVFTEPGVSVRQIHFPYSSTTPWEVAYGVIKSDYIHNINIQILVRSEGEFVIKQGQPLAVHIPYERKATKMENIYLGDNKKYRNILSKNLFKYKGVLRINKSGYFKL